MDKDQSKVQTNLIAAEKKRYPQSATTQNGIVHVVIHFTTDKSSFDLSATN